MWPRSDDSDRSRLAELQSRYDRLYSDFKNLEFNLDSAVKSNAALERTHRDALAKLNKSESEQKEAAEQAKRTAEELKALKTTALQARTQYAHEKRKLERDLAATKQKMLRQSLDRLRDSGVRVTIAAPIASASNVGVAVSEDMYQTHMRICQEREEQMRSENDMLKESIYHMWVELATMHSAVSDFAPVQLLPFDKVRDSVETLLRCAIQRVHNDWDAGSAQKISQLEAELEKKQKIIDTLAHELTQQQAEIDDLAKNLGDMDPEQSSFAVSQNSPYTQPQHQFQTLPVPTLSSPMATAAAAPRAPLTNEQAFSYSTQRNNLYIPAQRPLTLPSQNSYSSPVRPTASTYNPTAASATNNLEYNRPLTPQGQQMTSRGAPYQPSSSRYQPRI